MFASNVGKTIHSNDLGRAVAELKIGKPYLIVSQKKHIVVQRLSNDDFALFDPQFGINNKPCDRNALCLEVKKALVLYGDSPIHYREISPLSKAIDFTKISKLTNLMQEKLTADISNDTGMTLSFRKE